MSIMPYIAAAALLCAATTGSAAPKQARPEIGRTVIIETAKGTIKIGLYEKDAPITTKNFIDLVNRKFYDGLTFHRVEPGILIQGGDPKGDGTGESEHKIKLEVSPKLKHDAPGVVAMARRSDPDSASCQFYITIVPLPQLDMGYAVFGRVTEGMERREEDPDRRRYENRANGAPATQTHETQSQIADQISKWDGTTNLVPCPASVTPLGWLQYHLIPLDGVECGLRLGKLQQDGVLPESRLWPLLAAERKLAHAEAPGLCHPDRTAPRRCLWGYLHGPASGVRHTAQSPHHASRACPAGTGVASGGQSGDASRRPVGSAHVCQPHQPGSDIPYSKRQKHGVPFHSPEAAGSEHLLGIPANPGTHRRNQIR